MRALVAPVVMTLLALGGCAATEIDPAIPDLPEPDPVPDDDDDDDFDWPIDTDTPDPPGIDPDNWLYRYQSGLWAFSTGEAGALTGDLWILEFVDYQIPEPEEPEEPEDPDDPDHDPEEPNPRPWEDLEESPLHCEVHYAIVGLPAEQLCAECDAAFDLTFTVVEGDPRPCFDPELPADGETRRFGWRVLGPGEVGVIAHDIADIGVWVPWFHAIFGEGDLSVHFQDRQPISLPDPDDD